MTVGLLLNAKCDLRKVSEFVDTLRSIHGLSRILVRPHPGFSDENLHVIDNAEVHTWRDPLSSFLDRLDIAFAPNSNVIIDALLHGVPTVYVPGLDSFQSDQHGYVAGGIVPEYSQTDRYPEDLWDFFTDEMFQKAWATLGYSSDTREERETLRALCCPGNE